MWHHSCVRVIWRESYSYGVALVSRIDKIIGLFCKRALQTSQYSAKETYNFIDSTIRSHPIVPICDITPVYAWYDVSRDLFICATWLIHMCNMTHSYVWYNSLSCVWHDWHSRARHDSLSLKRWVTLTSQMSEWRQKWMAPKAAAEELWGGYD